MRSEIEKAVPFVAEQILLIGSLVGGGVVEQGWVSIEGMEFALDTFFGDEAVEIESGLRCDWVRENIAECDAAIAEACEDAVEIGALFGSEVEPLMLSNGRMSFIMSND